MNNLLGIKALTLAELKYLFQLKSYPNTYGSTPSFDFFYLVVQKKPQLITSFPTSKKSWKNHWF